MSARAPWKIWREEWEQRVAMVGRRPSSDARRAREAREAPIRGGDGRFTTVDVPGAVATFIFGNDDRGDLAGYFVDSSGAILGFVAFKK